MNQPPDRRDNPAGASDGLGRNAVSRLKAIDEADRLNEYAIRLGASNPPFDCEIFSADYRSRLPKNDPTRQASELREYGSEVSLRTMTAANTACLAVLGIPQPR